MADMTIGAVARLAGITVRTLHHYDEIGLLEPSGRTDAGYRVYDRRDLERLQEILYLRELDLPLGEIAAILDIPGVDRREVLGRQRRMLHKKMNRLEQLIATVEGALRAEEQGEPMTAEDMLEVFGDFDPSEYAAEAEERWGGTDAYQESLRRSSRYTKDDWSKIQKEASAINGAFLALMGEGQAADSLEAMDLANRHREHISRWFYDCSAEIHLGLAEMYVADPRFTASIDEAGEGLAAFMAAAIRANASRDA